MDFEILSFASDLPSIVKRDCATSMSLFDDNATNFNWWSEETLPKDRVAMEPAFSVTGGNSCWSSFSLVGRIQVGKTCTFACLKGGIRKTYWQKLSQKG